MKPIFTIILTFCFFFSFGQNNNSCADTSYRMRISSPGKDFRFYTHCSTADGGTVLIGKLSDTITNDTTIIVLKLSTTGGVVWKTGFQNLSGNGSYFSRIIEQPNGDIVAYGYTTSFNTANTREIILIKLTATGAVVWSNKYGVNNHFASDDFLYPFFLSEGLNSDLLFTIQGEHYDPVYDSVYSLTVRINNNGHIIWSKAFTNDVNTGFMNPSGIYEKNGEVFSFGYVDGPCALGNFLTLYAIKMNYNTGNPITVKAYCHSSILGNGSESSSAVERDWFNSVRLLDGQFALFGRFPTITNKRYGYKIIFNGQLDLVEAREYNIPYVSSRILSRLSVLPDGTTNFYYLNGTNRMLYWASLDSSNNMIRQRKMLVDANGNTLGGFLNFGYRNKETYNFFTNYLFNSQRYSLFTQVQKNDPTIDSCLGSDTAFASSNPISYSRTNWTWKNIIDNPVVSTPITLMPSDFVIETESLCTQVSRCDSLRISGPDTLCVTNSFTNFTGLKNPECHKRVLWQMNNALIDSSYQPNDSTLSVRFKIPQNNAPQTLILYASAANCTIAKDTAQIVLLPGVTPLPPDTVICGAVNIRLTPGKWGKHYLWQDGSTDSVFTATDTGHYTVQVETVCGGTFYDTINITQPTVSLRADKRLCAGDTVTLWATPGFARYQWKQNGSLISAIDSIIKVAPADTAQYVVVAQTAAGCTVTDTMTVTVLHPAPVYLGKDTTFCSGDSIRLQAPAIFASYLWSNGSTSSNIYVARSNTYWVKATDSNHCSSADSILILPLYAKPIVSIAPKGIVCIGQTDTLRMAQSFATYQWQNQSTNAFLPVTDTGRYWVTVLDNNGCRGSDTALITKLAAPPFHFLQADIIVCAGNVVELKPTQTFSRYLWSNGDATPAIEVSSAGLYHLLVMDKNNCTGRDSIAVTLKACLNKIFFPTAFSPNGDGKNDMLKPFVDGHLVSYQFTVYNRWGQAVFQTSDYKKGWSGRFGDLFQNTGVFVWLCQYQFSGEEKKMEKGTVLLVR